MKQSFELFNKNVFTEDNLKKHLSKNDFKKYKEMITNNTELNIARAQKVADIIKNWAIERGATHYCHWFQPLSGKIAEKQTSFLGVDLLSKPIIDFPASALTVGETDASSFPNGGLRSVFEARGLTKWDYTYPIFLKEDSNGVVLCIPTIMESPDGTSLDKRTPLLNSCEALNKQVLRLLKLFGDNETTGTFSAVGIEQEYFLINKEYFDNRKDLKLTGKTLFGKELIGKAQTHYMSTISENTGKFMKVVEEELWKLGVPAQVKHNEVAPKQYELVPHYENLINAANHDFLTMEILEREAKKLNRICLLNEKPFKGMNGSGKHNNWSINTNNGIQLFSYGKTPVENVRFLTLIIALISAVDTHSELIRATVASSNNDNRLSGYEAPSSICSIYLGEELTNVFETIINDRNNKIKLGITPLELSKTNLTDRNRTSPFAFLGNRFEFRMPGSSSSVTVCNTVLNTIMAESISSISNKLENSKDFYNDLKRIIINLYKEHSKIIYNGNSYSEDWQKEAQKRGLKNIKTAPEAFKAFIKEDSIKMFEEFNVYRKDELISRYTIKLSKYVKNLQLEAKTMLEIASQDVLPQVLKYINFLSDTKEKTNIKFIEKDYKQLIELADSLNDNIYNLKNELEKLYNIETIGEKAKHCSNSLKEQMQILRDNVDDLEGFLPKEYWPMPTYSDILDN